MGAYPKWFIVVAVAASILTTSTLAFAERAARANDVAQNDTDRDGNATGELEQTAVLSEADQIEWADEAIDRMEQLSARISALLDQANQSGDMLKIQCLNDKLTQINVSMRSFEGRQADHREAINGRNADQRNHQYSMMVILAQRVAGLRVEAEACVGEGDVVFGQTSRTTEIDASVTQDDPTDRFYDILLDNIFPMRPAAASGAY